MLVSCELAGEASCCSSAMRSVYVRLSAECWLPDAEEQPDDVQAVAQEMAPKPVLPVEKMLSKKVCSVFPVGPVCMPKLARRPLRLLQR